MNVNWTFYLTVIDTCCVFSKQRKYNIFVLHRPINFVFKLNYVKAKNNYFVLVLKSTNLCIKEFKQLMSAS